MLPKICFKLKPFNRVWSKVDGPKNQSGRSVQKWTVLSQTGRPWVKVDGHSTKTGRFFWMNQSVKVDGPKVSKWTVQKFQSGRSKSVKLDRPKVIK